MTRLSARRRRRWLKAIIDSLSGLEKRAYKRSTARSVPLAAAALGADGGGPGAEL